VPVPSSTETLFEVGGRAEAARAGAEQHRDVVRVEVGHRQVRLAIVVEVADRDRVRAIAGGDVGRRSEMTRAGAQQHRDVARNEVGEHQVAVAIVVQVADRDEGRARPGRERRLRSEGQ
jgi:hypothetical protein